mmetsp:Transcript_33644/g.49464  ORF Transcript_33644/g.49464 Transcript_33644/m.49464 type:complete len:366 (+) Transcript_33644:138-1235(+)|eukprot:CAMPEP_0195522046 /NCGR_PEP_ID=MMETSP0794_2-20130614/19925_1 /TAXON_ID=515487 /ORGANISM="Stephanopyxis turris, Strain CCMP 815" /LENGTH=365 /DNA_ID=CAMNT_0040651725 /DNA_START=133 /DNA_END=1230 /DNA_ORIENTATION=-
MSSQGPYGRHGYSSQGPDSYGGAAPNSGGGGAAYSAPGYGGASYSAPAPMGGYPQAQAQYAQQGSSMSSGPGYQSDKGEDKSKIGKKSNALQSVNQSVIMWAAFLGCSMMVYFILSSGDFSFILTYGSLSRMFGFGILNVKTFKTQRASGISIKSLQLYCIVFVCRLSSIIRHEGYLPYDKSGDWLYHVLEFMALAFTASALYGCLGPFKKSYQAEFDTFGEIHVPPGFGAVYLAVPCLILAILIHPGLNSDFMSDVAWTFAMYLESMALVPQLFMFQRQTSGVVELLTAHFVFALGFGRVLEFVFWAYSYHELSSGGSNFIGYIALFAQFTQLVLMLDFFWYYYQAVKNATPLVLPSHAGLGVV